jgi:putative transposase
MIGDIKHVFNRGVNKINTFNTDADRERFIECLYKFNNKDSAIRSEAENFFADPPPQEEKIVEILKWTLIPNHFHLLLYEVVEGGITEFVKRLGNGYTKYFNIKNKRSGYLFQNTAKMILLENDQQFLYIPYYLDMNALDTKFINWKEDGIKDTKLAINFLNNYKWSSFSDYTRQPATLTSGRDYSCVINKEMFYDLFDVNEEQYQKEIASLIKNPIPKMKL